MGLVTKGYTPTTNDIPTAAQWNAMVDPIYSEINGSLDENNVDYTSADGIATLQNAQTFTGAKTFNNDTVIGNGYGLNIGDATQQVVSSGDGSTDLTPELQVLGTAQADSSSLHGAWSTTATRAAAPTLGLLKSGNATIGSHTIVTDGEILGSIIAYGDDGTDYESPAAAIEFAVDGTPGTGDMPGRIVFYTTADDGETLTEAMRLNADQTTTFAGILTVGGIDLGTNGNRIDFDTDNDTSLRASADDTLMVEIAGADDFSFTANSFNVLTGSTIDFADSAPATFGTGDDATLQFDGTNMVYNTAGYHSFTGGDLHVGNGQGLVVGHSAQLTAAGAVQEFQIVGTGNATDSSMAFQNFSDNAGSASIYFTKSRAASIGTYTAVNDNDQLGLIQFLAADGTDVQNSAAFMGAYADAAASSNSVSGRLVFAVANATTDASEVARIDGSGRLLVGHTAGLAGTYVHAKTSGVTRTRTETTSTTSAVSVDMVAAASSTGQIQLRWIQGDGGGTANNEAYVEYYSGSNGRLAMNGGSAGADVWRLNDGATDMLGNTSWLDNQFDYVCGDCGWHSLNNPENAECPECGGHVEWHDDNALIFDVVSTEDRREQGLDRLGKLGVICRYGDDDGGDFISFQKAHQYTWSAMSQMYQAIKSQQAEIESLKRKVV